MVTPSAAGMAVDPATDGYWVAVADSHVAAINALSYGPMGGTTHYGAVVGMAADPSTGGY